MPFGALLGGLGGGLIGGLTSKLLNNNASPGYNPTLPQASQINAPSLSCLPEAMQLPDPAAQAYNPNIAKSTFNMNQDVEGQNRAAQMGQYGMSGPSGTVKWTGDAANGDRMLNVELSDLDKQKQNAALQMMPSLNGSYGDGADQRAQNSVYEMFDRRMQPQFERDERRLTNLLLTRGIPIGSEAYNSAMRDLQQGHADERANARNQSVLTGQQVQNQKLSNLLSLFGTVNNINNPMNNYIPGLGGNFTNSYQSMQNNQHLYDQMGTQAEIAKHNTSAQAGLARHNAAAQRDLAQLEAAKQFELARHNSAAQADLARMNASTQFELAKMQNDRERQQANRKTNSSTGSGIASTLGKFVGGIFSDARIKENIIPVGKLYNGLTVYRFNFKGDPITRLGLIAQEVRSLKPQAVSQDAEGLLTVDYDAATQLG